MMEVTTQKDFDLIKAYMKKNPVTSQPTFRVASIVVVA